MSLVTADDGTQPVAEAGREADQECRQPHDRDREEERVFAADDVPDPTEPA